MLKKEKLVLVLIVFLLIVTGLFFYLISSESNKSVSTNPISRPQAPADPEKKLTEKATQVGIPEGEILGINDASLKVKMTLDFETWNANIRIDQSTRFATIGSAEKPMGEELTLKDFKVGDKIAFFSQDVILVDTQEFSVDSIFKLN